MLKELNPAKKPYFDGFVANPPFSYRWDPTEAIGDDGRFKSHCLVPKSAADFANLFYSAGISVCILVLKKCKKPDDVLFINAAEHFEKGKRQNRLTEANIDTYQFRKEEDRYSKRISMERIAEEGHNLNISRYISTAVADQEIVLKDTHADPIRIEKDIQTAVRKHNQFLKELGLPSLP